ncbi:hypothetical protein HPB47_002242 [Ixodes persulcatus]|uniref:Uncharacterized protein n=1 Tax=Ixodes persulcatus TaxID=34615 RepID=A0AC60PN14_IXOPE|nr:hypothetical protein HPB47_002242 [Ixodes persulcatus]
MMTSRRRLRRIFRSLDASEVERTKRRKEQVRTAAVIHRLRTHFAIIPVRRHNMRWDADPACQALQRGLGASVMPFIGARSSSSSLSSRPRFTNSVVTSMLSRAPGGVFYATRVVLQGAMWCHHVVLQGARPASPREGSPRR